MDQTKITESLQNLLQEAVLKIPADFAEIRAEEISASRIEFKGANPNVIAEPYSLGFFIRILINGSWGIVTFSDITLLKSKINEAIKFAKIQGKGNVILADQVVNLASVTVPMKKDFRLVPFPKKVALVKNYNQLLLKSTPGIQTTNTVYGDNFLTKFYVNSRGANIFQQRPYIRLSYQAIAQNKDVIEISRNSQGHVGGFEIVENLEPNIRTTAKEAVEIAKAPKVKSGNYTVILDPYMAGTFAHEAFGHFSEADHQYENPQLLEQMQIGRKLGSEAVTIIDDPSIHEAWGNFVYDDEGSLGKRVSLLTNGFITGRLHSLETAGKLNELPNGRARADGFHSKPIVRMSNTLFVGGKENLKSMISTTKQGILVINWIGGMTAMENFTFTAVYGVMIENGKLTKKVRGVKLMGNVFETLKNIDAISTDFLHDQGTCGKQGQNMPVGAGGGYVRINNITVGGE